MTDTRNTQPQAEVRSVSFILSFIVYCERDNVEWWVIWYSNDTDKQGRWWCVTLYVYMNGDKCACMDL